MISNLILDENNDRARNISCLSAEYVDFESLSLITPFNQDVIQQR